MAASRSTVALSVLVPRTAWDGYMSSTGEELAALLLLLLFLKLSWIKLPLFSRVGCSVPGKTGCLKRWGTSNVFNKPTVKRVGTEQTQPCTPPSALPQILLNRSSSQHPCPPQKLFTQTLLYGKHPSHIFSSTAEENRREVATEQERKAFCCTEAKKLSVA